MKNTLLLLAAGAGLAFAQGPPPEPKSPPSPPAPGPQSPPPPGAPDRREGPPRGPDGGKGDRPSRPFAEMRNRFEGGGGMDQLSEEDRRKIRTAMESVWNDDSVKAARDGAADAAKKYRDALHDAAIQKDPSIKPLLDKIASKMDRAPFGPGPGGPGGPGPDARGPGQDGRGPDGRGPDVRNQGGEQDRRRGPRGEGAGPADGGPRIPGLEPQEIAKLPENLRRQLPDVIAKIMASPAVKEAREKLEAAKGEDKREAYQKMRGTVREMVEKEFPELAKAIGEIRAKGPGAAEGRPSEPGTPPPPAAQQPPAPPANTPGAPENAPPK